MKVLHLSERLIERIEYDNEGDAIIACRQDRSNQTVLDGAVDVVRLTKSEVDYDCTPISDDDELDPFTTRTISHAMTYFSPSEAVTIEYFKSRATNAQCLALRSGGKSILVFGEVEA